MSNICSKEVTDSMTLSVSGLLQVHFHLKRENTGKWMFLILTHSD